MNETLGLISARLDQGSFTQHSVVNVAKLVKMQKDTELAQSVASCDLVNVDGMGVVWAARMLGHHVPERVTGIDLFTSLLELAEHRSYPIYLLGATEGVLIKTEMMMKKDHPKLLVAGSHHGYFTGEEEQQIVDGIRGSEAKLLFVAISSPKKEKFIARWGNQLGVTFVMGVGGSFDVYSGEVLRAPTWMQKNGLEWLFRLCQEPRRMAVRYISTNVKFLLMFLREYVNHLRSKL